jgi:hypothetical protein
MIADPDEPAGDDDVLLAGTLSLRRSSMKLLKWMASAWQVPLYPIPLLAPFTYIADGAFAGRGEGIRHRADYDRRPGAPHRLMWTYVTRFAIEDTKSGLGSAMSWVTVIVSLAFTVYLFRQLVSRGLSNDDHSVSLTGVESGDCERFRLDCAAGAGFATFWIILTAFRRIRKSMLAARLIPRERTLEAYANMFGLTRTYSSAWPSKLICATRLSSRC